MVVSLMPLVKQVVGRMAMTLPSHVDIEDLHSAGLVGLLNAVRQFNPACRTSIETYARVRIRGAVLDELRRLDWVPRSVHERARRVEVVIQRLEQIKGRPPTDTEVARELNLSLEAYQDLLEEIRPAVFVSLDAAYGGGEDPDTSRHDSVADDTQIQPEDAAARHELSQLIAHRLDQLPEMQRKVLALYYFEDMRLREIAEVFGVTESRICQIHAQAILAIRSYLRHHEDSGSPVSAAVHP